MALQVADNVRTRRGHAAAGFACPREAGAHEGFRDSFPAESGRDEGVGEDRVFIVGGILENGFAVIGGDEEAAGVGVVGDVHGSRYMLELARQQARSIIRWTEERRVYRPNSR